MTLCWVAGLSGTGKSTIVRELSRTTTEPPAPPSSTPTNPSSPSSTRPVPQRVEVRDGSGPASAMRSCRRSELAVAATRVVPVVAGATTCSSGSDGGFLAARPGVYPLAGCRPIAARRDTRLPGPWRSTVTRSIPTEPRRPATRRRPAPFGMPRRCRRVLRARRRRAAGR